MWNSRNSDNVERRGWNGRRVSSADDSQKNWRNLVVLRRPNNGRIDYRGNYENGRQGNNCSTSGIDFRGMIEDVTIEDTNLEMRVKMTILVERTAKIEVRVRILVEAIGSKWVLIKCFEA
ncbi:hypothetical protein TNCV_758941 [Trichonephila clavipes]|nr:hypothetical protein TNCV_758941 [Trichonephila clavipes]